MLEPVLGLGETIRLMEKLGGLKVRQPLPQRFIRQLGDRVQQWKRDARSNHGCRLEQLLVHGRQAIDARRDDWLYGRGQLNGRERPDEAVGAGPAGERPQLRERPNALFEKEWVAPGTLRQHLLQRLKGRVISQKCIEKIS